MNKMDSQKAIRIGLNTQKLAIRQITYRHHLDTTPVSPRQNFPSRTKAASRELTHNYTTAKLLSRGSGKVTEASFSINSTRRIYTNSRNKPRICTDTQKIKYILLSRRNAGKNEELEKSAHQLSETRIRKVLPKSQPVTQLDPKLLTKPLPEPREDYLPLLDTAQTMFLGRNCKNTTESLNELILLALKKNDLEALGAAFLLKGMVEHYFKDYPSACESLIEVRNIADLLEDHILKMGGYYYLGLCFLKLQMHELALKCFKKQLDLAWEVKDTTIEIQCYDLIGMQYFYLGNLNKASYYHQKMMDGKKEPETSDLRIQRHKKFKRAKAARDKDQAYYQYTVQVYLQEIRKFYEAKENEKKGLRFFESHKPSNAAITYKKPKALTMEHNIKFAKHPTDLSLTDLPSPHSHLDFNSPNIFSSRPAEKSEMEYSEKFERTILKCPALVTYLHKRRNLDRTKTPGRRIENVKTKLVNQQILVTHRSASRGAKRPNYDVVLDSVVKAFLYFPDGSKFAALRKFVENC